MTQLEAQNLTQRQRPRPPSPLTIALAVYLLLAIPLSFPQRFYINADFVAYATLAQRLLHHPSQSLASHWSPLFSWLIAPLIALGFPAPLAARVILIAAGGLYIIACNRVVQRWLSSDHRAAQIVRAAVLVCAVVQAAEWSSFLLDADLLAAALLFCYFAAIAPESNEADTRNNPSSPFFAGVFASLAFLAKSYMLPFVLVHFLISMVIAYASNRRATQLLPSLGNPAEGWGEGLVRASLLFFIPFLLICSSWITILSFHYGQFLISTAGSSDHAASTPELFGQDILWHPGLVRDYIANPIFGPDWSPFASQALFHHQLKIICQNLANLSGHLGIWILYFVIAAALWIFYRFIRRVPLLQKSESTCIAWSIATALIYPSGYLLLIIDRRYVAPVLAPILCLSSSILIWSVCRDAQSSGSFIKRLMFLPPALASAVLGILFSVQDIFSAIRNVLDHPQMHNLQAARLVATQLQSQFPNTAQIAANEYHLGLMVSFARDTVANYLGAPKSLDPTHLWSDLTSSHANAFLAWVDRDQPYALPPTWRLAATVRDPSLLPYHVEVYVPAPNAPER